MNINKIVFCVAVGIIFCANMCAMQGLTAAVSGIARRATTESQVGSRAALLASVRASQGAGLRAAPLSRGFASSSYDPEEGNEVAERLKKIASYSRIDGIEFVHARFARREKDVKRHSVLMQQKQLNASESAELDLVEQRLRENDRWMFQLRDSVEQNAMYSMISQADNREWKWQQRREFNAFALKVFGGLGGVFLLYVVGDRCIRGQ